MTPEQKQEIDNKFPTLEVFAWCITCATLLIGAEKSNSFWGKKTVKIGQMHRHGTHHEVYVGPQDNQTPRCIVSISQAVRP